MTRLTMRLRKIRWELAKILRFDNMVVIMPTMRCNQDCWYCCQKYVDHGEHPEQGYKFWIDFIRRKKIKVLSISGGECYLYHGIEHIINYCIDNKILVSVVTNLSEIIPGIKKSWRVTFLASYHEGSDLRNFMANYTCLSKDFHITVVELHNDHRKILPFSRLQVIKTDWEMGDSKCPYIAYYPDGSIVPKYKFDEKKSSIAGFILYTLRSISGYKKRFT